MGGGSFWVGCISFLFGAGGDALLRTEVVRLDDPLAAFGIHGGAGMWGVLAPAFFAATSCTNSGDTAVIGLFYGGGGDAWKMLVNQTVGLFVLTSWAYFGTLIAMLSLSTLGFECRAKLLCEILGAEKEEQILHEVRNNLTETTAEKATSHAKTHAINQKTVKENISGLNRLLGPLAVGRIDSK